MKGVTKKLFLSSVYGKFAVGKVCPFSTPFTSKSLPLRCATCAALIRDRRNHEILGKFTQFAKVQCSKCRKLPNPI